LQIVEHNLPKGVKIVNVVATADLSQKLSITKLNNYPWGIYDEATYKGICGYIKSPEMIGKVTVFSSGKMISIGAKSIDDAVQLLNQAKFYLLQEKLIKDIGLKPIICNIVATTQFGNSFDLQNLMRILPNSKYDPKQFAGIIYKRKKNPTALIFGSGKVVILGAKSLQELNLVYFQLKKKLRP